MVLGPEHIMSYVHDHFFKLAAQEAYMAKTNMESI
jgi:hypothetical protein